MANRELRDRGSRKHVLDLVQSQSFSQTLNSLLSSTVLQLADSPDLQPYGRQDVNAWSEFELEEYLSLAERQFPGLPPLERNWWLRHRTGLNRSPTWDLIARLKDRTELPKGLLLVEAKANISELKIDDSKSRPSQSAESIENDSQIKRRIADANATLNQLGCGHFGLSDQSHYQLANRIAFAVYLANQGYQIVLLYLGFTGDVYFNDAIRDEFQWQRVVGDYLQGVVPQTFPDRHFATNSGGSLHFLVRSLPVIEISE